MITTITKEKAIELLKIKKRGFETQVYRHKIKKIKNGLYHKKDIDFLLSIQRKRKIEVFNPVYITAIYHIYESKINYDPTI